MIYRRITLVQQSGMKKAGIDIQNGIIRAQTDNFQIVNSNGEQTFSVDADGNLESSGNASFKGKIMATSGSFLGSSNGYEINLDSDNRLFSVRGPIGTTGKNSTTPFSGAMTIEYFSVGNFINTGVADSGCYFITPQIKMTRSTRLDYSGHIDLTLDAFNGLMMKSIYNNAEIGAAYYTINGMRTGPDIFISNYANLKNRNNVVVGQVYIDGEALKIRLT